MLTTYIKHNMLDQKIEDIVDAIDYESIESLRRGGMEIRQSFLNGKFQKK
jgi:phosphoenolpyruvate synthase/pyruvate phosphate dikinase